MIERYLLSDYRSTTFGPHAFANPVTLGDLWDPGDRHFMARPGDVEHAALLRVNDWLHVLYDRPASLLRLLDALPRESKPKFVALPDIFWPYVRQHFPTLHFNNHSLYIFDGTPTPPEIWQVDPLRTEDLDTFAEHQPYLDEYGGLAYIRHCQQRGRTGAIHHGGELAAWAVLQDDGSLGFLRVRPSFRRRGMALDLLRALSTQQAQQGLRTLSHINVRNPASQRLFEKAGFRPGGQVSWIRERTPEEIRRLENAHL